jgi:NAD(P)-dependent dehydrogenase (short-subunit alcohol dehydrogenase family)
MDIKGKTVIITGSTGKLASQIVLHLAKRGANCVCIYQKNVKKTQEIVKKLQKNAKKVIFLRANLTKQREISQIFKKIKNLPTPQILINAAAVFDKKPLAKITEKYIKETFAVNFFAGIMMTQKFVKIVGRKKAKIINITDAITEKHQPGFAVYSASKSALENATKILAKELAPNITVNAISPGIIHWPENIAKKKTKKIPTNATTGVGKVLQAINFIIENDSIAGRIINTDKQRK